MTSPATQEPCPKCGGRMTAEAVGEFRNWSECRECGHRWDYRKPPSQRVELLTQEQTAQLDDLMERMKHCSRGNTSYPWLQVTRNEAAALLQHIAALTQRVEALEVALDPRQWDEPLSDAWHRNIPDVQQAFRALRDAALSQEPRNG